MTVTFKAAKLLDKKVPEWITQTPAATAGGTNVCADRLGIVGSGGVTAGGGVRQNSMFVVNATTAYSYSPDEDSWVQLPSPALTGTFGNGACSEYRAISAPAGVQNITCSAGSTTTLTTSLTIVANLAGCEIRVIAGTGTGYVGVVKSNTLGANAVITVATASGNAFSATTVFNLYAGSAWVLSAGTLAAGCFNVWDRATNTWTQRSITNLPATWGTDGRLTGTPSRESKTSGPLDKGTATSGASTSLTDSSKAWTVGIWVNAQVRITAGTGIGQVRTITANTATALTVATWTVTPDATSVYQIEQTANFPGAGFVNGVATAGAASTLTDSTKAWVTNAFTNYQVRIVAGTGLGQVRTVASNTATVLTVGSAWTTQPDTTSIYVLEGNDDFLYLMGNGQVTLYKYVISTNTWSTLSPGSARGGAPTSGLGSEWVCDVPDALWNDGSYGTTLTGINRQNGRYIYSFRGTSSSLLDAYDIALNTWVAITYGNQAETFTAGSSSCYLDGFIYIQNPNGRIFKFDVAQNMLHPFTTNPQPQGTGVVGTKMFPVKFSDVGTATYLYSMSNTSQIFQRWYVV